MPHKITLWRLATAGLRAERREDRKLTPDLVKHSLCRYHSKYEMLMAEVGGRVALEAK